MRRQHLIYALIISVLMNLGVMGAAGYRALQQRGATETNVADRLGLTAEQRQRWSALEASFVRELDAGWRDIAVHRERLIREVFSDRPETARIEASRARIAELQARQQHQVIAQFLGERDILTAEQRRALVDLLLSETPAVPREQQLHTR